MKRLSDIQTARSGTVGAPSVDMERRDFLKRSTAAFALAGLGAVRATPSLAQVYPTQPIRLIVPFPAGGAADVVARITAKYMTDQLGQQVFIDNRGGAGGTTGHRFRRTCHAGRLYAGDAHDIFGGAQQVSLHAREAGRGHEVRADFPDRHRCPAPCHQCQACLRRICRSSSRF